MTIIFKRVYYYTKHACIHEHTMLMHIERVQRPTVVASVSLTAGNYAVTVVTRLTAGYGNINTAVTSLNSNKSKK